MAYYCGHSRESRHGRLLDWAGMRGYHMSNDVDWLRGNGGIFHRLEEND